MSHQTKAGCTVFIGNIDFDVTEEQIIKEMSTVGKVVSYRHMYDKNTGKSKGYGFCEYESPEIAAAAMKKLKPVFNGRNAKINYAENDLPTNMATNEDETRDEYVIEQIIKNEGNEEILLYFKELATNQPEYLKQLFKDNPNVVCLCMQMLLDNEIVKQDVIDLLYESMSLYGNREQIEHRIKTITTKEMEGLPEATKQRLFKIKMMITRK